ncbi:Leucine Rich Repeat family protein [Histomonas meleagridis]|uniref:Leucine Rich Repeat family protein n=1 Tax=Histomonas meleagridis TaxID=135588 RepID=UPI00355ACB22|nr:Leucine Rich Repeat family protein [Histomonas meleagridis]KAH0806353.1 Leucine Rich Repeat family protein [Histomonas meleagridis]
MIEKIEGLDELTNLSTLCLSYNFISKIENLSNLINLHTLELDHNRISDPSSLAGIHDVPSLGVLNISCNKIESEQFLDVISSHKSLNLLKMDGNPITRTMRQYRRRIISSMPNLNYLDEAPVTEKERRCAAAYMNGGKNAEEAERQKIRDEIENAKILNRQKLKRINRQAAIDAGLDISNDTYLMSTSDYEEDKNDITDID